MNQPVADAESVESSLEAATRIVIVGGVAGGASAAARARRCNAQAEITILERGPNVSFANCGLPYHLGGEIEERDKLLVATPKLFWERFRILVRTEHDVKKIDRRAKTISGLDGSGQEFKVPYDKLILATGSEPVRPPFFDESAENVFQLWTLQDMDRILEYMKSRPCKKAVVVGAGFVGLEVVEQLVRREISVSLVEMLPQVLGPLDPEMAKLIEKRLDKAGVRVYLESKVDELLTNKRRATAVKLADDETIPADLVIVGAGVRPRTRLAKEADLPLGEQHGVTVNEFCQTPDPDVYSVGDMIEYEHGVLSAKTRMPLAGPANRAGRVAGSHAASSDPQRTAPLGPVQGTAIVRVFDQVAATTGLNERLCRMNQIEYRTATVQAAHHASYFPGAKNLTLKILYAPNGRLLGAQAVGVEGVDKRIDVCATALQFNASVQDLAQLDLCYAPPFGSAKDPVHMAGFVAENDLAGSPSLLPFDADLSSYQIVDVRNLSEHEKLPMEPNAISIPVDEITERYRELDPSLPTVVICHSGKRAHVAACLLQGHGFKQVWNLNGGMSIRRLRKDAKANEPQPI